MVVQPIIHLQKYNAQRYIMHHFLTYIDKNCTEEFRIEVYKETDKKNLFFQRDLETLFTGAQVVPVNKLYKITGNIKRFPAPAWLWQPSGIRQHWHLSYS